MVVGFDVRTTEAAWAAVDRGVVVAHNIENLNGDVVDRSILAMEIGERLAHGLGRVRMAAAEIIPGRNSGQRGAQEINGIALACLMGMKMNHEECDCHQVVNRTWMSKTCGFDGRANLSKDGIAEWVHGTYEMEKLPYLAEWVVHAGKSNERHEHKVSDIYDAICIATWAEREHLADGGE